MARNTRRQLGILAGLLAILLVVLVYNRDGDPVIATTGAPGAADRRDTGEPGRRRGGGAPRRLDARAARAAGRQPQPVSLPAARRRRRQPSVAGPTRRCGCAGATGGSRRCLSGPPPPPPIALKFIGVVEQAPSRLKLAVLSDGRNVFYGKEGEVIEGRYRIERIGVESIEMVYVDGRGRQTLRLSGS